MSEDHTHVEVRDLPTSRACVIPWTSGDKLARIFGGHERARSASCKRVGSTNIRIRRGPLDARWVPEDQALIGSIADYRGTVGEERGP